MTNRTKLEVVIGAVTLLVLSFEVYDRIQHVIDNRVAAVTAQHDRDLDQKLNAKFKEVDDLRTQIQHDYDAKSAALPKLTPQQIVVKLPEYVPNATQPVTVLKPTDAAVTSGQAHVGDAIVPQQDIKPIAQALLDGQKCTKDLALCAQDTDTWKQKYDTKTDEAKQWETTAKGGGAGRRLKRCGILGGAAFGLSFSATPNTPAGNHQLRNGLIGLGIVGTTCWFIR